MPSRLLCALFLLLPATHAAGLSGTNASLGSRPPDGTAALRASGPLCATTTPNFKVWWSELGGAAIAGSDGSCTSVPPAAEESATALERGRATLRTMGFPAVVGDPVPALRIPGSYRVLVRQRASARATTFRRMSALRRGRLLSGFSAKQRANLLRGLPVPLQRVLRRDLARAQTGRPSDFIGGDRRVDVVLHPNNVALGGNDGVTRCRWNSALTGATRFAGTSMAIQTPGPGANVTTLAHELFHVVQCNMGADESPAELLMEGSAEWSAGVLEPLSFVGTGTSDGGGVEIRGGATSAAAFCNGFAPRLGGQESYRSWPVWSVLERQAPGTVRDILVRAIAGTVRTADGTVAAVGRERWSAALVEAVADVCVALRAPGGAALPTQVRSFIGWDENGFLTARGGAAPVVVAAPIAGVTSARALVGPSASAYVAADALSGPALQLRLRATSSDGTVLTTSADATGVIVTRPATPDGLVILTFANPSTTTPAGLTISVR